MVPVPLLVLGSQLTGLATALFLAHQGFPVHVLEREAQDAADDYLVIVTPPALRELAVLGLADAVVAAAWEPRHLVHADAESGAVLRTAELGPAVRARFGGPFVLVSERVLRALLVAACEADEMVVVEYGVTATSVEDVGDCVLVTADHGVVYRAEALVGADGPGSPVRPHLGGGHPVSTPYIQHRAAGPAPADDTVRIWSSPALHVTQARAGDRTGDDAGEITAIVRIDAVDEMRHDTVQAVVARLLATMAPEVRHAAGEALAGTDPRVFRHHVPLQRWTHHRMTVVGCAAQPMLPHAGYIMASSLLDAAALGRAFDHSDGRIVAALDEYTASRGPARAVAASRALDFATLCHADGLMRRLRDRLWRTAAVDTVAAIVGASGWGPLPGPGGPGGLAGGLTGPARVTPRNGPAEHSRTVPVTDMTHAPRGAPADPPGPPGSHGPPGPHGPRGPEGSIAG